MAATTGWQVGPTSTHRTRSIKKLISILTIRFSFIEGTSQAICGVPVFLDYSFHFITTYFCVGLFGESGSVICKETPNKGSIYFFFILYLSFNPKYALISDIDFGV